MQTARMPSATAREGRISFAGFGTASEGLLARSLPFRAVSEGPSLAIPESPSECNSDSPSPLGRRQVLAHD